MKRAMPYNEILVVKKQKQYNQTLRSLNADNVPDHENDSSRVESLSLRSRFIMNFLSESLRNSAVDG